MRGGSGHAGRDRRKRAIDPPPSPEPCQIAYVRARRRVLEARRSITRAPAVGLAYARLSHVVLAAKRRSGGVGH
jgi:hypothetical protein